MDKEAIIKKYEGKTKAQLKAIHYDLSVEFNERQSELKVLAVEAQLVDAMIKDQLQTKLGKSEPKRTVPEGFTVRGKIKKGEK